MSTQKKAIVFLCEGAEEMEFTISGMSFEWVYFEKMYDDG